jgi:aspartate carbamoyltransferase catalytic subunit
LHSIPSAYPDPIEAAPDLHDLPRLPVRHLLGIAELTGHDILSIFHTALRLRDDILRPHRKSDLLRGRTIVNLFAEPSTRTRSSFELAERRMGADVVNFSAVESSFTKGETLLDTVRNIEAMHVDAIVVRHSAAGVPRYLAERCSSIFINAGDGRHEHPTQALLDTLTLYERWCGEEMEDRGSRNDAASNSALRTPHSVLPFSGRRVTIVGDILHGRVALSNIYALQKLGAEVAVCAPPTLIPCGIERLGVRVFNRLEEAIEFSDALNMLRVQKERMDRAFFPSVGEYTRLFGLNHWKLRDLKKELLILHPGPINRGVELDSETADGPRSVILEQVENGVAVRMAVLGMLLGGE